MFFCDPRFFVILFDMCTLVPHLAPASLIILQDFTPSAAATKCTTAICTPNKLQHMLKDGTFSFANIRYVVLDEVDKLLDLGFREQIDEVLSHLPENVEAARNGEAVPVVEPASKRAKREEISTQVERKQKTSILLFSATLPENVIDLADSVLRNPLKMHIGAQAAANEKVEQRLVFIGKEDQGKLFTLRNLLHTGDLKLPCLVFVQSKERAKQLCEEFGAEKLLSAGVGNTASSGAGASGSSSTSASGKASGAVIPRVDYISADRSKEERDAAVKNFRLGRTWVLVTTDLLSRGVDFKNVAMVVNYDMPCNQSTYIHRIGRCGRAGREGKSITFFTEDDQPNLRPIVNVVRNSGCGDKLPKWMLALKKPRKHRQDKNVNSDFFKQVKRKAISTSGHPGEKRRVRKGGFGKKGAKGSTGGDAAAAAEGASKSKIGRKAAAKRSNSGSVEGSEGKTSSKTAAKKKKRTAKKD